MYLAVRLMENFDKNLARTNLEEAETKHILFAKKIF